MHAAAAISLSESIIESIIPIPSPLFSSPLLWSSLLRLSPGFSGVPEDLLPDFDLKIMPGRGIMYSTTCLLSFTRANVAQTSKLVHASLLVKCAMFNSHV